MPKDDLIEHALKACLPLRKAYRSIVLRNVSAAMRSKGIDDEKIITEVYAAVIEKLEHR